MKFIFVNLLILAIIIAVSCTRNESAKIGKAEMTALNKSVSKFTSFCAAYMDQDEVDPRMRNSYRMRFGQMIKKRRDNHKRNDMARAAVMLARLNNDGINSHRLNAMREFGKMIYKNPACCGSDFYQTIKKGAGEIVKVLDDPNNLAQPNCN